MQDAIAGKKRRRRTVLIAVCLVSSLIITWVVIDLPTFTRSVSIQFDWEESKGFKSISVEWPPLGPLYSHLIATQAGPHIASNFEKVGWRSARGRLNVRVFCLLFVLSLDRYNAWNVEIIDPEVTPLMHAVEDGDTASAERMIAEGTNVNAQDQRGWTALIHVSMKGRATEAKLLLAAGADPNMKDRDGRTAFLWAAWNCRSDVAIALIDAGADVNAKDRYGSSALSSTPCPGVVQEILKKAAKAAQAQETMDPKDGTLHCKSRSGPPAGRSSRSAVRSSSGVPAVAYSGAAPSIRAKALSRTGVSCAVR